MVFNKSFVSYMDDELDREAKGKAPKAKKQQNHT